jgi:hypothetical protein
MGRPTTLDADERRREIRARLASGALPPYIGGKVFGSGASGRLCDCCGLVIDGSGLEYEIELPSVTVLAHPQCWHEWASL